MDVPDAGPRPDSRKAPLNGRKTLCFCGFRLPHLRQRISPNYTPSAPELRLIATQLFDQIGCTKRCVSVPGLSMSKCSAKSVAALFASVMAGANLATVTDLRAQAATADDCLTAPKGATSGQPLVLSHRSRDQTSMLVPSGRDRQGQRQVHPRHAAGFNAGDFGAAAEPAEQRRRVRSRAKRSPTRAPNTSPSDPAPNRRPLPIPNRKRPALRPPHQPFRTASAARGERARADPAGHDAIVR